MAGFWRRWNEKQRQFAHKYQFDNRYAVICLVPLVVALSVVPQPLSIRTLYKLQHEGVVVDAERSEPVISFTVSSTAVLDTEPGVPRRFNPFTGGQLFEGESGRFRLDSVAAGTAWLRVDAPGYAAAEIEVVVTEDAVTRAGSINRAAALARIARRTSICALALANAASLANTSYLDLSSAWVEIDWVRASVWARWNSPR